MVFDRYDDLALRMSVFEITDGLGHIAERVSPVDDGNDLRAARRSPRKARSVLLIRATKKVIFILPIRESRGPRSTAWKIWTTAADHDIRSVPAEPRL